MKKKKPIAICGDFIGDGINWGIARVTYEMIRELDKLCEKGEFVLVVRKGGKVIPEYQNIEVKYVGGKYSWNMVKGRSFWVQFEYALYVLLKRYKSITLNNEMPLLAPGLAYLHDIYFTVNEPYNHHVKNGLLQRITRLLYRNITHRAKHIVTVSDFSKREIMRVYGTAEEKISVVPCGWDHELRIEEDESVFEQFPAIQKGEYYFALGNKSVHKNLKWIYIHSQKHDGTYVITGKMPEDQKQLLNTGKNNVIFVGKVSDNRIAALYRHCKAFIFPSFYEGFGIPPMEAMSRGSRVILSNISPLTDIYGDTACYIDPDQTDVDLDTLLETKVEPCRALLEAHTWKKQAEKLLKVVRENL